MTVQSGASIAISFGILDLIVYLYYRKRTSRHTCLCSKMAFVKYVGIAPYILVSPEVVCF
jgi:hypothetical protein